MILRILVTLSLLASAVALSQHRAGELERSTGTIVGIVLDANSRMPLQHVFVSANHMGDESDKAGRFKIPYQSPGEVEVVASRRDLLEAKAKVTAIAGKQVSLTILMHFAPPAQCKLEGKWSLCLVLDSVLDVGPKYTPRPTSRVVNGTVTFDKSKSSKTSATGLGTADRTLVEHGSYDVDLRPFFGDDIANTASTTIYRAGSWKSILREASGFVSAGDFASIDFIPGMSHGGISMTGRVSGDSIVGKWFKREYAPIVFGHFVMRRIRY